MAKIQNNYRYERKFYLDNYDIHDLEYVIMSHPAFFNEIFHQRRINNIYFDDLDLNNFNDNIIGNNNRIKYRIRWYGETFTTVQNPTLELKIKKGLMGKKYLHSFPKFEIRQQCDISKFYKEISDSNLEQIIKHNLLEQRPVLLNSYIRKYFQSYNKKFRLTVDINQSFYKLNSFNNLFIDRYNDNDSIIVELKYHVENNCEANNITNYFPFRLTKSSKYSRGIELLYS